MENLQLYYIQIRIAIELRLSTQRPTGADFGRLRRVVNKFHFLNERRTLCFNAYAQCTTTYAYPGCEMTIFKNRSLKDGKI